MAKRLLLSAALAGLLAGCANQGQCPTPPQLVALPPADTVIVLASDTNFGPDLSNAEVAARYYCSSRGKFAQFESRQRPPEMRNTVLPEFSLLTFRCIIPAS